MPLERRSIKVIITPYDGDANPYPRLLATSLNAIGLMVDLAWFHRFPLWHAVQENGWPDVIHLQWQHSYFTARRWPKAVLRTIMFFFQWFTLRLLGVRFVWTVHNLVSHEERQARWELMACRLLARAMDSIIVHCATAKSVVATAYQVAPERLHIVPHGHYANWYPPALTKEDARRRLGWPNDVHVFLFFGSIRAYKGVDGLLEAFAALEEKKIRLILVGKPFSKSVEGQISAQVASDPRVIAYFGFVPNDRLIAYLSACDLVILPYRNSLTSGAAVLAASYSRPIMVPKQGCMGEFPPEAAILYDPEKPDGIQKALRQALSAPLAPMGSAAKSYIEQFSWSLVAAKTLGVYQMVLGRGHDE
jgi:glycosyltransferase involved in cell wall biosynthesis